MKKLNYFILSILIFISYFIISFKLSLSLDIKASNNYNFTNLIVFAKFDGEEEFINDTYSNESILTLIDNMFNNSYYSVKKYYELVSNNKLRMQNVYLFDNQSSITLHHKRGYYAEYSNLNPIGYKDNIEMNSRRYDLKEDWANSINNLFKKSSNIYDSKGNVINDYSCLDLNNDNKIDCITVLFKKSPNNINVSWNSPLWNIEDYNSLVEYNINNKTIYSGEYIQITDSFTDTSVYQDELNYKICPTSVFIHEMGHVFGLKDLYNYNQQSLVYYMSAMAKHLSPIPQYISSKEREALNWLNDDQIKEITTPGRYKLKLVSDLNNNDTIAYKINIPSNGKTAYLEYRSFENNDNRFDNQNKKLFNSKGELYKGINIKSGLICYLADSNTKFPNNMNSSGNKWNYQVLGGNTNTKVDSALDIDDEIDLSNQLYVYVVNRTSNELEFEIQGKEFDNIKSPIINSIKIINSPLSLKRNDEYSFKVSIDGENLTGKETIYWSIENNTSNNTIIDEYGNLKIDKYENSNSILVKASINNIIYDSIEINLIIIHELIHYDKNDSTCIKKGNIEYWYCEECNSYFNDSNHSIKIAYNDIFIPLLDHIIEIIKGYESTCNNSGLSDGKKCILCNEIIEEQKEIPKLDHIIEIIKGYESTCNNSGLSDGKKCILCNEIIEEQKEIPKLEHVISDWIIDKEATSNEDGEKHKECIKCHEVLEKEIISKINSSNNSYNIFYLFPKYLIEISNSFIFILIIIFLIFKR